MGWTLRILLHGSGHAASYNWSLGHSFMAPHVCTLMLCAANGGIELVQKRRTMNQEWSTFFDSHLYNGRVIHMLVMDQATKTKLADIQVGIHILANYCRQNSDHPVEQPVRRLILNDKLMNSSYFNFHFTSLSFHSYFRLCYVPKRFGSLGD